MNTNKRNIEIFIFRLVFVWNQFLEDIINYYYDSSWTFRGNFNRSVKWKCDFSKVQLVLINSPTLKVEDNLKSEYHFSFTLLWNTNFLNVFWLRQELNESSQCLSFCLSIYSLFCLPGLSLSKGLNPYISSSSLS